MQIYKYSPKLPKEFRGIFNLLINNYTRQIIVFLRLGLFFSCLQNLLLFYLRHEIIKAYHVYVGEWCIAKYIVMMIVCYNILSIASNGTIYKLVVVRIVWYQVEVIIWCYEFCVYVVCYYAKSCFCKFCTGEFLKQFSIFFKDFCRYTQSVSAVEQWYPQIVIYASAGDALKKAICVNNESCHCLF